MTEYFSKLPDYFYSQSGVIPYFYKDDQLMIVLIKSRQGKKWIIPKGIIEPEMTPWDSAAKEALEEAGVEGKVSNEEIYEYRKEKWGGTCHIKVYLMEVINIHSVWEEDFRERKILPYKKASHKVEIRHLRKIIKTLPKIINPKC